MSILRKFWYLGLAPVMTMLALSFFAAAPAEVEAQPAVPCVVQSSSVDGGQIRFTVGPENCNVATAPISGSSYRLPGGDIQPFDEQVAFYHNPNNGNTYTAGTYSLNVRLPECNWQSDLYWGDDQPTAPHQHPLNGMGIGWDYEEGNDCRPRVTPTPTSTPTRQPTRTPTPTVVTTPTATPTVPPVTTQVVFCPPLNLWISIGMYCPQPPVVATATPTATGTASSVPPKVVGAPPTLIPSATPPRVVPSVVPQVAKTGNAGLVDEGRDTAENAGLVGVAFVLTLGVFAAAFAAGARVATRKR